ncbi:hypothetical protein RS030_203052 [Cryptosporidium xiaoi]|uniref:Kinesin motor domain-containing protein n=1 Tax=Cryptosporidium xiaoi TaxID=659607 RepID=A0AAV9XY10_9CRYT
MGSKKNTGYIRIIGENNNICDLEVKYIVLKCLTGSFNSLLCSADKGRGKTNFIYGSKYGDNFSTSDEKVTNESNICFIEKLTKSLFIESNIIKSRFMEKNIIFLPKFSCSFLMIKVCKDENCNLENVYDALQGLVNPVNYTFSNDYNYFELLQVDIQEPVQLLNLITIARKLQLEKACEGNANFHTLLIINIESILLNKELNELKTLKKASSQIFILDYISTGKETSRPHFEELYEKKVNKELLITFLKSLINSRSKSSLFLFSILVKGILNKTFITIIFSRFNNLNIKLSKSELYSNDSTNMQLNNFGVKIISDNPLSSQVEKLHCYTSFLNKMYLEFGIEYIINSLKHGNIELTNVFEELAISIYNLSGNIFDFYEISNFINNFHVLLNFDKSEVDNKKGSDSINFADIYDHISFWLKEINAGEKNNQMELYPLNDLSNHKVNNTGIISECYNNESYSSIVKQVDRREKNIDSIDNNIDYKPDNFENEIRESLTERKCELNNTRLEKTEQYQSLNRLGRSKSCMNIPMNYNLPTKVSVAAFSKILLAVNTARRRVREYRKKQQSQIIGRIDLYDEDQRVNTFWGTVYKTPGTSLEDTDLKESPLTVDPIAKGDSCDAQKRETKDVEVQVDVAMINLRERNKLVEVRCIQIDTRGDGTVDNLNSLENIPKDNTTNIPNISHSRKLIERTNEREMLSTNPSTKNSNVSYYPMTNFCSNNGQFSL